MLLQSIELTNYRNYDKYKIKFEKTTVFVGKNGIGKSNIVEAIFLLGFAKSFRTNKDEALIKYEKPYAQVQAKTTNGNYNFVLTRENDKVKKQISIDKKRLTITQIVGKLQIVLFDPQSLNIVTGSPKERRRFLDLVISQSNKKYLKTLIEYRKILRSRNEILKKISLRNGNVNELVFWDKKFIQNAKIILEKRQDFISYLQKKINDYYASIAIDKKFVIRLKYTSSVDDSERFADYLENIKDREILFGKTLAGPHLDDIKILANDKNAVDTCSRGEIRSITLALKIGEIEYLKNNSRNKDLLLLLDDIFSELDRERRSQIIKIIADHQAIITTTDEEFVKKNLGKIKLIKL